MKLGDLGERSIIERLFKMHNIRQEKDDCALIDMGEKYLLISTDSISSHTHVPVGTPPELIGSFFASLNLSDIAAMAGEPVGFMTAFSFEPDVDVDYFEGIGAGIDKVLSKYGVELLGGDMKEGPNQVMNGVAIGMQNKKLTRKRSDIKKGQIVGITNSLGRAAAGYVFYRSGFKKSLGIKLMLDFEPRINEAIKISEHGGKFMMDLSDGVFSSIHQMKHDYGLGFKIVEDELKPDKYVQKAADISGASMTDLTAGYGGDYELLFTIDNSSYGDFAKAMEAEKIDVSFIGEVWEGENMLYDGSRWNLITNKGYEHFSKSPVLGRIH